MGADAFLAANHKAKPGKPFIEANFERSKIVSTVTVKGLRQGLHITTPGSDTESTDIDEARKPDIVMDTEGFELKSLGIEIMV